MPLALLLVRRSPSRTVSRGWRQRAAAAPRSCVRGPVGTRNRNRNRNGGPNPLATLCRSLNTHRLLVFAIGAASMTRRLGLGLLTSRLWLSAVRRERLLSDPRGNGDDRPRWKFRGGAWRAFVPLNRLRRSHCSLLTAELLARRTSARWRWQWRGGDDGLGGGLVWCCLQHLAAGVRQKAARPHP